MTVARAWVLAECGRWLLKLGGRIQAHGQMMIFAVEGHPIPPRAPRRPLGRPMTPAARGERRVLFGLLALIVALVVFKIGDIHGYGLGLDRAGESRRAIETERARIEAEAEAEAARFAASFRCVAHDLSRGGIRCVAWEQRP